MNRKVFKPMNAHKKKMSNERNYPDEYKIHEPVSLIGILKLI
jgi:hypothetical protein